MKRIMISALNSGSGKTTVACALLCALQKRGIGAEAYKCGPDYIDPMFHRKVLGLPCRNLDYFLQGEKGIARTLSSQSREVAVLEGAMGYYDGAHGTVTGSAWHIAEITDTPVLLVLDPKGVGPTLCAQIRGIQSYRNPSRIAGLLLNNCRESLYTYLRPILEKECALPVLGYLPKMEECSFESRHLGLVTADETEDFHKKIDMLAKTLEEHCDLPALLSLCAESREENPIMPEEKHRCKIAIARDAAFSFYYEENQEVLQRAGAELLFFSPMNDPVLPECDGLYLGGGYPELYCPELKENKTMLKSIKNAVLNGLPTVAECGGFLYLQQSLNGNAMVGVLPGEGFKTDRLQRFGYLTLEAKEDSLLFRKGERIPAHEFHYFDTTDNGSDLVCRKEGRPEWECGFCTGTLYAGFPHLHFGGELPLGQRFASAAAEYKKEKI